MHFNILLPPFLAGFLLWRRAAAAQGIFQLSIAAAAVPTAILAAKRAKDGVLAVPADSSGATGAEVGAAQGICPGWRGLGPGSEPDLTGKAS